MLGSVVDISAENIADKGIAKKGNIPPSQQYGYVYKGRLKAILSKTRPVEKTGRLRSMFRAFASYAQASGNYTVSRNEMVARVWDFAGGYKMTWRSFSARLGSIENRDVTSDARRIIPGIKPKDYPLLGEKHLPRRFVSRRFNPALRALRKALEQWGNGFSSSVKSPNAPPRKIKPPKLTLGD